MAASGKAAKGGLGWLLLAAALAVPGFLFYNWWSQMKAAHDRSVTSKARGRLPEGSLFQTSSAPAKLVNPIAPATADIAAQPPAVAAAPAAIPAEAPITSSAPASTATIAAAPALPRDPMLSPMDLIKIRDIELAKERSRREIEEANRRRHQPRGKRVDPPIEKDVELQGIVATPHEAALAIVNGATVAAGESFAVRGHAEKVRIVRISSVAVTFEYAKHRFTKSVNKE